MLARKNQVINECLQEIAYLPNERIKFSLAWALKNLLKVGREKDTSMVFSAEQTALGMVNFIRIDGNLAVLNTSQWKIIGNVFAKLGIKKIDLGPCAIEEKWINRTWDGYIYPKQQMDWSGLLEMLRIAKATHVRLPNNFNQQTSINRFEMIGKIEQILDTNPSYLSPKLFQTEGSLAKTAARFFVNQPISEIQNKLPIECIELIQEQQGICHTLKKLRL